MIKPLLDKVLVKMEKEEISKSGIILKNNNDRSYFGKVVEIGMGGKLNDEEIVMYVKKEDKIILNKYSGTEINCDGEEYLIISQKDILAIVE